MPRRVITTPQSKLSRRSFFAAAAGISLGLTGLRRSYGLDGLLPAPVVGFGPLVDDPHGLLALPEGFKYTIISRVGERMDDGFYVPDRHDGRTCDEQRFLDPPYTIALRATITKKVRTLR